MRTDVLKDVCAASIRSTEGGVKERGLRWEGLNYTVAVTWVSVALEKFWSCDVLSEMSFPQARCLSVCVPGSS